MHTRGLIARPWQRGLRLGAARAGDRLVISMRSEADWSGKLHFDIPRHRVYLGFVKDWPRMNTLPEWFTVNARQKYTVHDLDGNSETAYTGKQLGEGLPVRLVRGVKKHLVVGERN
jgi:hypothetical protein